MIENSQNNKMIKPKDCPFCGSDEVTVDHASFSQNTANYVVCENCEASSGVDYSNEQDAIVAWNKRNREIDDRQYADMVNDLTATAIKYKDAQCLREALSGVVRKYLKPETF